MGKREEQSLVLGVTGGIACGKSEVGTILSALGFQVLDTDAVAHEIMLPGKAAYDRIVEYFGSGILDESGEIDRKKLGKLVFGDTRNLEALNGFVHPSVCREYRKWLADKKRDGSRLAVIIPLLFEVGEEAGWDAIICVSSSTRKIVERLKMRGFSESEARIRIRSQMPLEEKIERADYVIRNNGSLGDLKESTADVVAEIIRNKR